MQSSYGRLHSAFAKPSPLRVKHIYVLHDAITEFESSRKALQFRGHANAQKDEKENMPLHDLIENEDDQMTIKDHSNVCGYMYPTLYAFPSTPCRSEESEELDSLDLSESQDDSSTLSFDLSLASEEEWEEELVELLDYPSTVADYRVHSCTVEVYDREHQRGNTVWFRVSYNGSTRYRDHEDTEILDFVAGAIELNPRICFYIKTKFGESDNAPASLFGSDLIIQALNSILQRAQCEDGIEIPNQTELLREHVPTNEEKEKPCFLSLFWVRSRVSDSQPIFFANETEFSDCH